MAAGPRPPGSSQSTTSSAAHRDERRLLSHVCPPDWRNPNPAPIYDLVVIGGGTAGLVSAVGAAGLGARVALIERSRLGGDCLNAGCVPSKALLRAARAVHEAQAAAEFGVRASASVDFPAVMARLRATRETIAPHDSAARLTSLGVDVFFGAASFRDERRVDVDGTTLRFRRAVIATGSRAAVPSIRGLEPHRVLTSETLFELSAQPASMLIIGAGPVGCEMAQAFALLGTQVVLVEAASRVLPHEDPDASAILARSLVASGVTPLTGVAVEQAKADDAGTTVVLSSGTVTADAVLVATGRTPAVERLALDAAGIQVDARGVVVDDHLRTSNRRVFAAGDVCSRYGYTHAADAMARVVIQNALFAGRRRASALRIPRCTYTIPEIAHVGDAPASAAAAQAITIPLDQVDRAVIDGNTDGFVRILHVRGQIRGATIVAPHAGELIAHVASVMQSGGTLGDLSQGIFPYPTLSEAFRKAGDTYRRRSLTPRVKGLLTRYFALARR